MELLVLLFIVVFVVAYRAQAVIPRLIQSRRPAPRTPRYGYLPPASQPHADPARQLRSAALLLQQLSGDQAWRLTPDTAAAAQSWIDAYEDGSLKLGAELSEAAAILMRAENQDEFAPMDEKVRSEVTEWLADYLQRNGKEGAS